MAWFYRQQKKGLHHRQSAHLTDFYEASMQLSEADVADATAVRPIDLNI